MPAQSNRARIGVIREVTPGTIPANPAFQTVRITSDGLTAKAKTQRSKEKRSDGNVVDVVILGKDIGGSLDAELSYAAHDVFLEEVLRAALVKTFEVVGVTSVAAGTGVYTVPNGTACPVGSKVKMTGFSNAANNGFFRVTGSTATTVTTTNAASVAEAAPPAASRIKSVGIIGAAAGNISATAGATNTISVTGTNPATIGLVAGMWFQAIGFTGTAANNGWYRCASIAGAGPYTITCDVVPTGFATDAAAGQTITLAFTDYVRNGTSYLTHATERAQLDLAAPIYDYRKGDRTDSMEFDTTNQSILGVKMAFLAMDDIAPSTVQFTGATAVAALTAPVMNTTSNVGREAEALTDLVAGTQNKPLGGKITFKSNLRAQPGKGTLGLVGTGLGTFEAMVEIDLYLDTPNILANVMANTASSYDTRLQDSNGAGYIIDMPTIKYLDGDNPTGAENTDVTPKLTAQGLLTQPSSGNPYTVHVQKFEAAS